MKKILVPCDFSKIADHALDIAITISKESGSEIYLLNIIEPQVSSGFKADGSMDYEYAVTEGDRFIYELHKVNEKKLYDMIDCRVTGNIAVYPMITIDKSYEGIVNFAHSNQIDLIVMGTSGENTFEEYFSGNHTERVMRDANCPVLILKDQNNNFKIKNIVIATDLRSSAFHGMEQIKEMLNIFKPKIHLLHIAKNANISIDQANRKLKDFAEKYQLEDYTQNVMHHNNLKLGIKKFAAEIMADVIVTFTHGRKGLSYLLKGSISENLVKQTNTPILSVHLDL